MRFLICVGALNVVIATLVLALSLFGVILAEIMIGPSLLIVGIEMIAAGVYARKQQQVDSKASFRR